MSTSPTCQSYPNQSAEDGFSSPAQREDRKKGRPKRVIPYVLPPLPNKRGATLTRLQIDQRNARSVLQNNAASLRYRRKQEEKRLQEESSMRELFLLNAQLFAKEARLKKGMQFMEKHIWHQASQGCGTCLQISLQTQARSWPPFHPMVKIEESCFEEVTRSKLPSVLSGLEPTCTGSPGPAAPLLPQTHPAPLRTTTDTPQI